MYSLFLLLLFMMAETKKVEIQQPQVPVQQVEQKFDRYSMGYTDRPINQRKQVINTYLDSIRINSTFDVATMSLYDITDTTITKLSGNYSWKKDTSPLKLYIPISGTYQISGRVFISSSIGVGLISTFIQINGGANSEVFSALAIHGTTIPILWTVNLDKGDYINIYLDNESDESVDGGIQLTITKIS